VPSFTDWEPEKVDFRFPFVPQQNSELLLDDENEAIGVRNFNGVTWLTAPDPREQFFRHVSSKGAGCQYPEHYGKGYFRVLTGNNPNEFILVCIAPLHELLREHFVFEKSSFKIEGGQWAVLKVAGERIVGKLMDEATEFGKA
jgi:hypothetical protein